MTYRFGKIFAALLAAVLCVSFAGCAQKPTATVPSEAAQGKKPILPSATDSGQIAADYTAVYVSVFGDLAILSTYPVLEYGGEKPECDPREISMGGSIRCGGEHEREEPIQRVLIAGELVPRAMNDWFRNLVYLVRIEGIEKVRTHHVTDMSHLFAGCERLAEVNVSGWDVSAVENLTGIFEGCTALVELPTWYAPDEETLD